MAKRRHNYTKVPVFNDEVDPDFISSLEEDMSEIYRNISDDNIAHFISIGKIRSTTVEDATIGTSETKIYHGLGQTPKVMIVVPTSEGTWWQTRDADSGYVYLRASGAMTANIIVQA